MSTPQSWSGGSRRQVDMSRRQADKVRWSWKVTEMGQGTDKGGKRQERKEGRSYHDITPLLCCYISEWHSSSSMSRAAQGGQSGGRGGTWGVRVAGMEFINYCQGMELQMGKP